MVLVEQGRWLLLGCFSTQVQRPRLWLKEDRKCVSIHWLGDIVMVLCRRQSYHLGDTDMHDELHEKIPFAVLLIYSD